MRVDSGWKKVQTLKPSKDFFLRVFGFFIPSILLALWLYIEMSFYALIFVHKNPLIVFFVLANSEVYTKFLEFEANSGDLSSYMKVEKRKLSLFKDVSSKYVLS